MISRDARLSLQRLPLGAILATEVQPRYPERLAHYVRLLSERPESDPGVVSVAPSVGATYRLLDGYHRFCAAIIVGRTDLLCLVIEEPEEPASLGAGEWRG